MADVVLTATLPRRADRLDAVNELAKKLLYDDGPGKPGLISIIIPCHNQAHFLAEAIESGLAQTYSPIEILVVDDGSTDQTAEVAAAYAEVRCIQQINQGLPAARNTGWLASQGAYLVFLDADDRLLPQALEAGIRHLNGHPECAFVSGHFRYIKRDGSFLDEHPQVPIDEDHYLALLRGNYISMHATVMYRRAALEAVGGFNPALAACEDYDVYLRLARRFPVARHGEVVAEYRQHQANMSGNPRLMLSTALSVLRAQWPYAKVDKPRRIAYRAGMRGWQAYYGEQLLAPANLDGTNGKGRPTVLDMVTLLRYAPRYLAQYTLGQTWLWGGEILQKVLPGPLSRRWRQWRGRDFDPPVGQVQLGDLRRLTPLCREFGYSRGRPVDRFYIERFLADHVQDICGRVLEIGDNSYTRRFGGERVTQSDVLHVKEGNPEATFVGDLTHADHLPSNSFDCIILTQTLHLVYQVGLALQTIHRILKPGGVLLATAPGISQISIDEWAEAWYWAFTVQAMRQLFQDNFAAAPVEIEAHGNVLAAAAFLFGLADEELRPAELAYQDPHYQLLITIRAVKPGDSLPPAS